MELFYSSDIDSEICRLPEEESIHCVRVLRHREGDVIDVIDGEGNLYHCRLTDASPKGAEAQVLSVEHAWGSHDYCLEMAVCPTKNMDRYEWFAEKATEVGMDSLVPVIGDHSERKVIKTERMRKILLSATKQSLKASVPQISEAVSVREYIRSKASSDDCLRLIAYCFEDESHPRRSIMEVLSGTELNKVAVLIGPEGDFSKEEAALAMESGFIPVHLGASRLRTETAALTSVEAVYFHWMK